MLKQSVICLLTCFFVSTFAASQGDSGAAVLSGLMLTPAKGSSEKIQITCRKLYIDKDNAVLQPLNLNSYGECVQAANQPYRVPIGIQRGSASKGSAATTKWIASERSPHGWYYYSSSTMNNSQVLHAAPTQKLICAPVEILFGHWNPATGMCDYSGASHVPVPTPTGGSLASPLVGGLP